MTCHGRLRWGVLAALVLACPGPAAALDPGRALTQYVQTAWRMEEGLPHNSIRAVLQRRDGYLWLGTYGGLARFDGVRFLVYDNTNSGLRDNEVRTLAEDADGTLWIGTTAGGLHRLRDGKIEPFDTGIQHRTINALAVAPDGSVLVGTGAGLYRVRGDSAAQEAQDLLGGTAIQCLAMAGDDVWAGLPSGLVQVSNGVAQRRTWVGAGNTEVLALHATADGGLWVGLLDGFQEVRLTASGPLVGGRRWLLPDSWYGAVAFLVDRHKTVWVGTYGNGLHRLTGDKLDHVSTEDGFLDHRAWALAEDREGHVWVGTRSGLVRLRDGPVKAFSSREGLPADVVRAVREEADGTLWLGSDKGLTRYRDGHLDHWKPSGAMQRGPARSLLRDRRGRFWIATAEGVVEMDTKKGTFIGRIDIAPALPSNSVRLLLEDRAGRVWIGSTRGLAVAERGLGRGPIAIPPGLADLSAQPVESLFEDREGGIWVGTVSDDLRRIVGDRIERPKLLPGVSVGVRSFYEDEDGTLYIGTIGSGLFVRRRGADFRRVTTRDGLVDDAIWSILRVGEHLWFSSDRGVFIIDRRHLLAFADTGSGRVHVLRSLGTPDGMKSRECNGGGGLPGLVARDGRVWYPTSVGAVVIDPRALETSPPPPPVVIEESLVDQHPSIGAPLVVSPGSRDLEIHYTGLSFLDPAHIAFRYRLRGHDDRWVEVGSRRVAYFSGLPIGRYHFEVQAANAGGAWGERAAGIEVRVDPRLTQRPLVRVAAAALVFLGLGAWLQWRAITHRRRERELERQVASRTAELGQLNQRLVHLATVDDLTGIANHRRFTEVLAEEWSRSQRSREPLSLLMLDIDDFKAFNDAYGHPQGDLCLQKVARAIEAAVQRVPDLAARYGGEEFAIVLPATDEAGAHAVAESIHSAILALEIPHRGSRAGTTLTASLGGATARPEPGAAAGPERLIAAADRALYAAKERGRDQVVFGEPASAASEVDAHRVREVDGREPPAS